MKQKRRKILLPTILLGILGGLIRIIEWGTAMNQGEGLAVENAPISIVLAVFSVAMIVGAYLVAAKLCKTENESKLNKGKLGKIVQLVGGVLIIAASALFGIGYLQIGIPLLTLIFVLGVFAGIAVITMNKADKAENNSGKKFMSIIPAAFCCAWTLLEYKVYATEPQIIKYAYFCLSNVSVTLAFYFIAGYYYDRKQPKWTVFSIILAVFFSLVVLFEATSEYVLLMRLGFILSIEAELPGIVKSMEQTENTPIEVAVTDEIPKADIKEETEEPEDTGDNE